MDGDRFDLLARELAAAPSRRAVTQALAGFSLASGLATLFGAERGEAKKKRKKKKKKCKGNKKKCGKKCIPKTSCCPACTGDQTCQNGACACPVDTFPCGQSCVAGNECCSDGDCAGNLQCTDGFCLCALPCEGGTCCNTNDDEICEAGVGCQAGGCPETDFCIDPETYQCASGCVCTTTVDPAPENACVVDPFSNPPPVCTECASNADCGAGEACIATGIFCGCGDASCVSLCDGGALLAAERVGAASLKAAVAAQGQGQGRKSVGRKRDGKKRRGH